MAHRHRGNIVFGGFQALHPVETPDVRAVGGVIDLAALDPAVLVPMVQPHFAAEMDTLLAAAQVSLRELAGNLATLPATQAAPPRQVDTWRQNRYAALYAFYSALCWLQDEPLTPEMLVQLPTVRIAELRAALGPVVANLRLAQHIRSGMPAAA